jgi:O-antigen/teichoic acid export membrane protein
MHRQRFISNTVFLVLTSLVAQVVNLFVLPLFIENLGEEMYGIFILSGILLGYLNLLDFGFTQGMTRYIARAHAEKDPVKLNQFIAAGFWFLTVIGIIAAGLIYFGRFAIVDFFNVTEANRPMAANLLAVTAFFSLIQWPARLPGTIMHATLHIKQISIWDAIQSVLTSVAMLLLVYYSVDVVSIRIATGFIGIIALLPKLLLVRRYVPQAKWTLHKFHFCRLREMSSFSLGMFYASVLVILSYGLDNAIIGRMVGLQSISLYAIATKLSKFVDKYTSHLMGVLQLTVFNLDTDQNRHRIQTLFEEAVRYRGIAITPLAYTCIIISPTFIRLWMGKEYAASCAIWSQLALSVFLINFFGVAGIVARAIGKLRLMNTIISISTVCNVVISIALAPHFGFAGPLIGTIITSILFGGFITFPLVCNACKISWKKTYLAGIGIVIINIPTALISYIILEHFPINRWPQLIFFSTLIVSIFYLTLFFAFIDGKRINDIRLLMQSFGVGRISLAEKAIERVFLLHSYIRGKIALLFVASTQ